MNTYFTITTNKETAIEVETYAKWEEKVGIERSYKLGNIDHQTNYSVVQICRADIDIPINPSDVFFLGKLSTPINIFNQPNKTK